MKKNIIVSISLGIAISVVGGIIILYDSSNNSEFNLISENDFIYSDIDEIQKILQKNDIIMSSPTVISDHTVDQYCTYFDNDNNQKFVKYCITTAITDSQGNPLGNINMGGNPINPIMALAIIETSPHINSYENEKNLVFDTLIEKLVCECWEQEQPGDFESVSDWLNAAEQQYGESSKTLKSKIDGLAQKQLILEISRTENSYLWTLIITK